jgi:hypothetical protein
MTHNSENHTNALTLTGAKNLIRHMNMRFLHEEQGVRKMIGEGWYMCRPGVSDTLTSELRPQFKWVGSHAYQQAIELTAKKLWKEAKKENKTKFVFCMYSEGFTYYDLKFYSDCFKYMGSQLLEWTKKATDWKEHNFAHIYGAHPHIINQQYLHTHYKNYELWTGMKFILTNHFEQMTQGYLSSVISDEARKEFEQLNSVPSVKPYKFVCYNNHPKMNRTYLVGLIVHRNLEAKGLMSLNLGHELDAEGRKNVWQSAVENCNSDYWIDEYFPRTGKEIFASMIENKEKMMALKPLGKPRWELADGEYDSYAGLDADGRNDFRAAYFGITIETKYFHDRNITLNEYSTESPESEGNIVPGTKDTLYVDCITFTEKTYKFISGKIPFILVGMPKSLHVLRDSGYKTFHPYINEDYDNIEDDELRLIAITDEIERLCNISDSEWLEIQKELIPRLEYNYNLLLTQTPAILSLSGRYEVD